MLWTNFVVLLSVMTAGTAINRPVYKIILTQKGFTQFLQYDVETPPLREFTFCTWIRIYELDNDQTIFTYVANGNNRVIRLWLDSGGRYMKIVVNEKVSTSIPVDIVKDVWRHVCLSYQSDYGAWALYIDSRLVSCEAAQSLNGVVIPGGGSVIIGYGTDDGGSPNGLEGEIFGANMILISTIERNYTVKNLPKYEQKSFERNKIRGTNNIEYIILNDLQTDEIHNNMEQTLLTPFLNRNKSYIHFKTPHSFVEHDVGIDLASRKPKQMDIFDEKEIFDIAVTNKSPSSNDNKIDFWNLVNQAGHVGKFRAQHKTKGEQSSSGTNELPTISEFETPPPLGHVSTEFTEKVSEIEKVPVSELGHKMKEQTSKPKNGRNLFNKRHMDRISEIEVPPPPPQDDNKVYGQWTSSKYAGSVLNYLKSINFHNKEKRVPPTIPLTKISDTFPYSSDLKVNIVRPPPIQPQRRHSVFNEQFNNKYPVKYQTKRLHMKKRDTYQPQINVKILEHDMRSDILRSHAQALPKHVEVTSRGETNKIKKHRFYRKVADQESSESSNEIFKPSPFSVGSVKNNYKHLKNFDIHKSNSLLTVLPFLKSVEYFTEESESADLSNNNDIYSKSLSHANKWHNIKSYNNDYTPRHINMKPGNGKIDLDNKIAEANRKHPSIRLKYKTETNKLIQSTNDEDIVKGRELALEVSNQSNYNKDSISILKYNHGFLPEHDKKMKFTTNLNWPSKPQFKRNRSNSRNSFDKHVKIGNALNEQHVIGINEEEKKQSFIGGNEKIPDIHRYRSDLDKETENVPSSLKPRVCKNVELYDHILYVQPDESIDMTHILSPVKMKNTGIEFVLQNYNKCSLEESTFVKSSLLFIHWSKTPVRLFGGAYPKKTTDLCGFF